jgi:hypothetical protein
VELGVAYVHGIDAARTMLEQAVGEAARGSTRIEADEAGHIQLVVFDGREELVRASTHEAFHAHELELRGYLVGVARFLDHDGLAFGMLLIEYGDFARHDEAAGLFLALGKSLVENELVGTGLGYHSAFLRFLL